MSSVITRQALRKCANDHIGTGLWDALDRITKVGKELWVTDDGVLGVKFGLNDYKILSEELVAVVLGLQKNEVSVPDKYEDVVWFEHDEAIAAKKCM